jgi:hypothetical protein
MDVGQLRTQMHRDVRVVRHPPRERRDERARIATVDRPVELERAAAEPVGALHEMDPVAHLPQRGRGRHPRDTAADDHGGVRDRDVGQRERLELAGSSHAHADQVFGLRGRRSGSSMDPRGLVADSHLEQDRLRPASRRVSWKIGSCVRGVRSRPPRLRPALAPAPCQRERVDEHACIVSRARRRGPAA